MVRPKGLKGTAIKLVQESQS